MADGKKFTEEEMKTLKEVQDKYVDIQTKLGQISMARLKVNQQMDILDQDEDNLLSEFKSNQKTEDEFVSKVREKYGEGSLDPKTGIFVPIPEENIKK